MFFVGRCVTKSAIGTLPVLFECGVCCKKTYWRVLRATSWITIFRFRIYPYGREYYKVCPNCHLVIPINEREAKEFVRQMKEERDIQKKADKMQEEYEMKHGSSEDDI